MLRHLSQKYVFVLCSYMISETPQSYQSLFHTKTSKTFIKIKLAVRCVLSTDLLNFSNQNT